METRVGITGSEGRIGLRLTKMGCKPLFCDVRNKVEAERELHRVKPDVVIHLAAQTSIEWCEEHYEDAIAVNVFGTNTVCEAAEDVIGAERVVLISSDQIFDGRKGDYTEEDEPNPINDYGRTKLAAEGVAQLYGDKVVRISRCFDSKSKDISEYIEQLKSGSPIMVPNFMLRSYCHLDLMASMLFEYAKRFDEMPEILNIAGMESYSFFDLVSGIAYTEGLDGHNIYPRSEVPGFAPRPHKTGLNIVRALKLNIPIPSIGMSIAKMKNENP